MSGPVEGPADLTPLQRQYLRNLRDYCDLPPTVLHICRKVWQRLVFLGVVGALGVWILLARELTVAAWFLGGMFVGAILRDFGYFRQTARLWPVTQLIIDRKKLDELIGEAQLEADW